MPLGFIHLIASETETGAGAIYYCGVEDAIAAINPARLSGFPVEMICPQCYQAHGDAPAGLTNGAPGKLE